MCIAENENEKRGRTTRVKAVISSELSSNELTPAASSSRAIQFYDSILTVERVAEVAS